MATRCPTIRQPERSVHPDRRIMDESGFTLAELLIVAAIACILAPISFLSLTRTIDEQSMKHFAEEIREVISDTQMDAISTATPVKIVFNTRDDYYSLIKGSKVIKRKLDPRMLVSSNVNTQSIMIGRQGNFSQPGTYTFSLGNIRYQLVLLLGQGRFHIARANW